VNDETPEKFSRLVAEEEEEDMSKKSSVYHIKEKTIKR